MRLRRRRRRCHVHETLVGGEACSAVPATSSRLSCTRRAFTCTPTHLAVDFDRFAQDVAERALAVLFEAQVVDGRAELAGDLL
jgi:hypothetical protein